MEFSVRNKLRVSRIEVKLVRRDFKAPDLTISAYCPEIGEGMWQVVRSFRL